MCCCWAVFCSLSSSAHSTPAAIEQQEIIVLALDILPLASLQTLQHVLILFSIKMNLFSSKLLINWHLNQNKHLMCCCCRCCHLSVKHFWINVYNVFLTGRGDKETYSPCSEIPEGHHWGLPGWDYGQEEPEAWGPQGPEGAGHQVRNCSWNFSGNQLIFFLFTNYNWS